MIADSGYLARLQGDPFRYSLFVISSDCFCDVKRVQLLVLRTQTETYIRHDSKKHGCSSFRVTERSKSQIESVSSHRSIARKISNPVEKES